MLTIQSEPLRLFPHLTLRRFTATEDATFLAVPNNTYDIVLILNGEIGFATTRYDERLRSLALLGMNAEAMHITFRSAVAGLHIRLEPQHLRELTALPLRELAQQPLNLAELWGTQAAQLQEKVLTATGLPAQIQVIEDFFARRYRPQDTRAARQIAGLIGPDLGGFTVKRLRETMNVSERQLERLFAEQIGPSPRAYLKVKRFQRVVTLFTHRKRLNGEALKPALLPLALEAGYYDQSHFIRDCKQLTGRTPEVYFADMDPVLSGSYNT